MDLLTYQKSESTFGYEAMHMCISPGMVFFRDGLNHYDRKQYHLS